VCVLAGLAVTSEARRHEVPDEITLMMYTILV
jgi:hypothetical protein